LINTNGTVTFSEKPGSGVKLSDLFDIFVGMVSGKDSVFKNEELGNIELVCGNNNILCGNTEVLCEKKLEKWIYLEKYPCDDPRVNSFLLSQKNRLLSRKIRKFNEKNWFEWGALRNISTVTENWGKECIYISTLTRKSEVAFLGKINYFGGGLLMLKPRIPMEKSMDLVKIVEFLNSESFRNEYTYSNRFKIGHRQLSNVII
jgi:adenine-specific DNA-methyltransferase